MRILLSLLLTVPLLSRAVEVEAVFDWQGATTAAPGEIGDLGSWVSEAHTRFGVSNRPAAMLFPSTVTVGGVAQTGAGTNWIVSDLEAGTGYDFLTFNFVSPITNAAVAGYYRHTITNNTSQTSLDMVTMSSGGVGYSVFNLFVSGLNGPVYARTHTDATHSDELVELVYDTTYFYILDRRAREGYVRLSFYDPANGFASLGSSTLTISTNATTYRMRFNSGYIGDVPGTAAYGPTMILVEPTDEDIAGLIQQPTFETVSNLVAVALAGDHVVMPAGTANWTNTLAITKAITLDGNGAWLTNWSVDSTPLFYASAACTISNLNISGAVFMEGGGIAVYSQNARITGNGFTMLSVPVWTWAASNVIDNCWFSENYMVAKFRGTTGVGNDLWTNYWPLPWNTLNASFIEDCWVTNTTDPAGTPLFFEGQRGMYVARRNHFFLSGAAQGYQFADAHGDDNSQRGTLLSVLSENYLHFSGGAYSLVSTFDLRGGSSLIVSNTFTGTTAPYVRLREECDIYSYPPGRDWVTNSYMWDNIGMNVAFVNTDGSSENYLTIGEPGESSFTLAAPADFTGLAPYPHPLRGSSSAPAEPAVSGGVTIGTGVAIGRNVTIGL